MKKINLTQMASLVIVLTLLVGSCTNATKAPMKAKLIPLEDFFKNPEKTRYQISPEIGRASCRERV